MLVTMTSDSLRLDRAWSDAEFAAYQRQIEERTSHGYYQHLVIEDAKGKRLQTNGSHLCVGSLANLDQHGFPKAKELTGRSVLDVGCNAGFYSFTAKLRGARSVVGIDHQPHYVDQALLMRDILGLDVDLRHSDAHSLTEESGMFDVVINTGVIYHLQNPMEFLTRMARITRELMYLETEMLTDPRHSEYAWFIEKEYGCDPSNWWIYGPLCAERMTRTAGFSRVEFQGFVWKPPAGMKTPEGFERQGRGAFLCWK
jgi:2-polyprenyl-3-methyl-5-hydroxy-6-metoxy-1,4-benzoquinol methylase